MRSVLIDDFLEELPEVHTGETRGAKHMSLCLGPRIAVQFTAKKIQSILDQSIDRKSPISSSEQFEAGCL